MLQTALEEEKGDADIFAFRRSGARAEVVQTALEKRSASPFPTPFGHRNNQVHVFDSEGIYLTEHHASRLIESVNIVFDPADSPFPMEEAFDGNLEVDRQLIRAGMPERDLDPARLTRDLPGEYSVKHKNCWIGISTKGRRDSHGKRRKPRYVVRVSVCF